MELKYYNSYLEVDLDVIRENLRKAQRHLAPAGIIPVCKGDALGMGAVPVARVLCDEFGFRLIAVAQMCEAIRLREAGFTDVGILVMGGVPAHVLPYAVSCDIQTAAFRPEAVRALDELAIAAGKTARVHVKLETGLNRIGARPGAELDALVAALKAAKRMHVSGVFTQYSACAANGDPFTYEQYGRFKQGVDQLRAGGFNPQYVHSCSTGAAVWFREGQADAAYCTHVRFGSLYFGQGQLADGGNPLGVNEPESWRAFVTNVHAIKNGESVGYGRHFIAPKDMRVATISIGYADGLLRALAMDQGAVLINNIKTRYLATCMDQTFVDVTGIGCAIGDEATIFGRDRTGTAHLPLLELEKHTGQAVGYIMSSVGSRVLRVYKNQ
ncbi:MAG TPA: alanine racemase [Clostridia bacterium]|nr:alanine racemase [Clostridia bacterium]